VNISVRAASREKPIIIFCRDEEIFIQQSSNPFQWVGPNGDGPLLPENNGMVKMIPAIQS
jgi:hypothetical protein